MYDWDVRGGCIWNIAPIKKFDLFAGDPDKNGNTNNPENKY